jgi:nucleoside-diphosphate-sugar epimerase
LIVGCGDVGTRVAGLLRGRVKLLALTSQPARVDTLRALGVTPLLGDLDNGASLRRLAGIATRVLHLAPPPIEGKSDPRTRLLARVLLLRRGPVALVYGSTSGVYGDCDGDWVPETRRVNAGTARARRRVDAEDTLRCMGRTTAIRVSVLRIPGIYAMDRENGTPRARLLKGLPVLQESDDVYTNHIQADDLARACHIALWRGAPQRVYNVNDDSCMKMGDYFDWAADSYGLARPRRISRHEAVKQLPPMLMSFMSESRRMVNLRMKRELRLQLSYPTVVSGLGQGGQPQDANLNQDQETRGARR